MAAIPAACYSPAARGHHPRVPVMLTPTTAAITSPDGTYWPSTASSSTTASGLHQSPATLGRAKVCSHCHRHSLSRTPVTSKPRKSNALIGVPAQTDCNQETPLPGHLTQISAVHQSTVQTSHLPYNPTGGDLRERMNSL